MMSMIPLRLRNGAESEKAYEHERNDVEIE